MIEQNPIIRLSNQRGGLSPDVTETLSLEFNLPLYYSEYQLRHPFGIYNVSLSKVFSSFENFLTEYAVSRQQDFKSIQSKPKWDENLLHNLEKLLYALMEHMDDCENIIKCFFPPKTKLNKEICFENYLLAVNSYRTHIGKVVNHLKHNQGRLRSFVMLVDNVPHLGYFVEGLSSDGSVGPAPNIHSRGLTAFSYTRDIRFHLYNLYYISMNLSDAICAISPPDKNKVVYQIDDKKLNLEKTLREIAQLPLVVFPDEIKKDFPHITVENEQDTIKFCATVKKHPFELITTLSHASCITSYQGDGVSCSFRMPYRKV